MLWPSRTCAAMASRSSSRRMRLIDHRLRLLAQVLRQVVEGGDGLAGAPRAFPAAERLVAGPRAGGGSLRAVGVGDTRLDVVLEPGDLVRGAVKAGGEAERGG